MSEQTEILSYDLSKRRPQILLVGNGITLQNGISTKELIKKTCKNNFNSEDFIDNNSDSISNKSIPFPILSMISSDLDDSIRRDKYLKAFENVNHRNGLVEKLSKMNFDAILTTNYTYEFEDCFVSDYSSKKNQNKIKFTLSMSDKKESNQLIYTCNHFNGSPLIWHIHGELRRKSSLILNHDEYARLIHKILQHNKEMNNKYKEHFQDLQIKSWIDYFIIADIYILGLSLSFAEFDLWWLLFRRMREHNSEIRGKIIFYDLWNQENECKYKTLKNCAVEVEHLNTNDEKPKLNNEVYLTFYEKAIKDIASKLENTTPKSAAFNAIDSIIYQENNKAG